MIKFIVTRPVLVAMLLIGLCLLGAVSYTKLPVELFPYTELPMLIVSITGPANADPSFVEKEAVIPMESAVAGLSDIERLESFIDRRRATIFVYYTQDTDQKIAYLKLQECVSAHQGDMSEDFTAAARKIDTSQLTNRYLTFQARGTGGLDRIRQIVDEKMVPDLESIDGVANVEVYGGREHSIEIIVDEKELEAYDLTMQQIAARISRGVSRRQFMGQVTEANKKIFVNLSTDYWKISQLENIVIKEKGPLLLRHIATIKDGGAERESISRINGMEAVTVMLIRGQDANLLGLAKDTRETIGRLQEKVKDDGITLAIQNDEALVIENNIDDILLLALIGGLLAIAVLWVFLRDFPLVLVAAAAIPVSVLISMNLFYALGITVNTLTLVGIAIAVGMLLDNSIVVLENIHRQLSLGKKPQDAVIIGTTEVWRAVFAATLTTVCVFLPFVFSGDYMVKTLGRQIGVAVISTLSVSLGVAFLLIPAFSLRYLKRRGCQPLPGASLGVSGAVPRQHALMKIYRLLLKSCLRFPARTVIISLAMFFISIILCLAVSVNVPEEVELETFDLYAIMPSGTTVEKADEHVVAMDKHLEKLEELKERAANIQEDNVIFTFTLKDDYRGIQGRELPEIKDEIITILSRAYPQVEFSYDAPAQNARFRGGSGGGGGGGGGSRATGNFSRMLGLGQTSEKVVIRGQDLDVMRSVAEDIQYNLDELDTVRFSRLNVSSQQPGVNLYLDKSALNHFNVPLSSITGELSGFRKEVSPGTRFKRESEEIQIIVKSKDEKDKTPADLRRLMVPSSTGGSIPIHQLARVIYSDGYSSINRVNQEKQIEVSYRFESDVEESAELLARARESVEQLVLGISIPDGVVVEVEHDESDYSEFYFLIFISVLLIYMVLASTFESLHTPFSMMFTLPLATIGVFWGLILTGGTLFNANVLVGFLVLLGVVVNNGIILIDYSRLLRTRRFRPSRALIEAGQARVRPILITTLTTVLAMLPVAMGQAEYISKIGAPFAVTVIGGLVAATLFTLLFVPTVSFGLENALRWWSGLELRVKLIQLGFFLLGLWLIIESIDSFLWQAVNVCALFIAVPAFTYFVQTSLRRTSSTLIPPGDAIKITIRNVVKVYDEYSRFVKEWRQAIKTPRKPFSMFNLTWQLPILAFLIYFTFFFLEAPIYILLFSIVTLAFILSLIKSFAGGPGGRFYKSAPLVAEGNLLKKRPFKALDRVSLEIGAGMFGLVGPNGAGKTTLMRIICGILSQSRGRVYFNGIDIGEKREELQSLIGYLPQEFGVYENMTAYSYLDYQAMMKGLWESEKRTEAVEKALKAVHLEDRRDHKIKSFSGGMKQRIGIAQTLLHLPRVLVVDEPTAGLDPRERIKFRNLLSELARDRIVIFSTHIIEDISSSCNRLAVLVKGKLKFLGTPREMVEMSRGSIWQAAVTDAEFEVLRKTRTIIHHLRDGEKIRARILAETKPHEKAELVTPTLEDSYMWMLGGKQ